MYVYVLLLIRVRPGPDDRQPQRWCIKLPVQQRFTAKLLHQLNAGALHDAEGARWKVPSVGSFL